MDEWQVCSKTHEKHRRETILLDHGLSQAFQVVGWREHEVLIAEGHYRCPNCRRADALEVSIAGICEY
jgi:hypothetical protein